MTEQKETQISRFEKPKVERAPDFQVIFANHVRVNVGPGEFGLVFGFADQTPNGQVTVEKLTIAFAPPMAKFLAVAMGAAINVYEQQQGAIKKLVNTPDEAQQVQQAIRDAVKPLFE